MAPIVERVGVDIADHQHVHGISSAATQINVMLEMSYKP
jgi:hypothetical protein